MTRRILVCILICIVMLFVSLATIFYHSGLVGDIGSYLAELNLEIFGVLAYFWSLGLMYIAILWCRRKLTQKVYAGILAIALICVVILCLQYLWFETGRLGHMFVESLRPFIGYFGIYILLICVLCGAWMLFSTHHFKSTISQALQALGQATITAANALKSAGISIYQKISQKYQERSQKRAAKQEEQRYEFNPEPPTPHTQVNEIPDHNIRIFYQNAQQPIDTPPVEIRFIAASDGDGGEVRDYSQRVLNKNKKFFAQLSKDPHSPAQEESQKFLPLQELGQDGAQNLEPSLGAKQSAREDLGQGARKEDAIEGTVQNLEQDIRKYMGQGTELENILGDSHQSAQGLETTARLDGISQSTDEGAGASLAPKYRPTQISQTKVVRELSENKELLESLEKGQIQKPRDYKLPSLDHLAPNPVQRGEVDESELDSKIQNLLAKLKMFKIDGDIVRTYSGPLVSTFEFRPAEHIKVRSILALSDDLAMALAAQSIRIQAPIPGKSVIGIEIPNSRIDTIYMREILESEVFQNSASPLTLALGKDIVGQPFVTDLKRLPHLLIAGTTGSGKSVGVNAMIVSLLYRNSPDHLKLIMIDPKMVEFSMYEDIPHLITPIITDAKKAISALGAAVKEMERRYKIMSTMKVKTLETYNQKCVQEGHFPFPFLVIIIDELADLMMTGGKDAEFPITRIAQMGRACGIHLIVATQRPSADVVTGIIKTNLPSRIAFRVSNKIDSRVVIDVEGAQSLLGRGDMLFTPPNQGGVIRLHAPWISEKEIEEIVSEIKAQRSCEYDEEFLVEEKEVLSPANVVSDLEDGSDLARAKEIILNDRKTSVSYLQRRMGIGFNKAANMIEQLEKEGFLSAPNAKGAREILP